MKYLPLVILAIISLLLVFAFIKIQAQSFNVTPTTVVCNLSESSPTCTINVFAHDPITIKGTNLPPNSNVVFTGTICGQNYSITTSADSTGTINMQRPQFINTPLYQLCSNFNGATTFSLSYSGYTINGTLYEPIVVVQGSTTHVLTQGQQIQTPVHVGWGSTTSGIPGIHNTYFYTYATTVVIQVLSGNRNIQVQTYTTRNIYNINSNPPPTTISLQYFGGKCGEWFGYSLNTVQNEQTLFYTQNTPNMLCLKPCDYDIQQYSALKYTTFTYNNNIGSVTLYNQPVIQTTSVPQPITLNIGNLVTTILTFTQGTQKNNPPVCTSGTTISQIVGIMQNQAPPPSPPPPGQSYVTLKIDIHGQT